MKSLDLDSTFVAAVIGAVTLVAITLVASPTDTTTTPANHGLSLNESLLYGAIVGAVVQTGVRLTGVS